MNVCITFFLVICIISIATVIGIYIRFRTAFGGYDVGMKDITIKEFIIGYINEKLRFEITFDTKMGQVQLEREKLCKLFKEL